MHKRHDVEMPSYCHDLQQLSLEGHGDAWRCMAELKAARKMNTSGLSAACPLSNEKISLKVVFESFIQV